MRVFVTGATGFIGSAIVGELREAGHDVLGLARSDASADQLESIGVAVHRGDLTDVESLSAGAGACDAVIHTAFIHDFSRHVENTAIDRRAPEAMTGVLEGTGKPLLAASGTAMLPSGRTVTEEDTPAPDNPAAHRARSDEVVLRAAERGVRSAIVRLPPTVHGAGDHGFVPRLIEIARRTGTAAYVGEGANRWPAVHRLDAARLFRLALEKEEPGARWHAVAEEGVPMRAIAETIAQGLGLPVRRLGPEEARAHFGDFLGAFIALDTPASSAFTRETLGWSPREIGLIQDMRENGYFS
jgi:nucleoside-diphosphate-sugar epimerase